jgi:hypothetical protein
MFQNFLKDEKVYHACEAYWESVILELSRSLDQEREWERWNPRFEPNGMPVECDGNPIVDGWNKRLNRAFRIVQAREPSEELDIAADLNRQNFVSTYANIELLIMIGLTEESAAIATELLKLWMTPTTTEEQVQEFILKRIEPHYRYE